METSIRPNSSLGISATDNRSNLWNPGRVVGCCNWWCHLRVQSLCSVWSEVERRTTNYVVSSLDATSSRPTDVTFLAHQHQHERIDALYNVHIARINCLHRFCQLEAWYSVECITDADHSITLNKTVLRGCVSSRDDRTMRDRLVTRRSRIVLSSAKSLRECATTYCNETVPHGCLVATLCTLWPCDLDLWPFDLIFIDGRGIVMDYPYAKFGDFCKV